MASSAPDASGRDFGGRTPVSTLVCSNCGKRNRIAPSARGAPHCGNCGKPLAWVVDADEMSFEIEARAQPLVVIDLWAPWCGPCRFVSPILDELAHQYAGRLKVVKINVDENQGGGMSIRRAAASRPWSSCATVPSWIASSARCPSPSSTPRSSGT